jgi:hypothetical protein
MKSKQFKTSPRVRESTRIRQQRFRNKRLEAERRIEDAEQQEAFDRDRERRGLICFGETAPLVNATTVAEEIEIAQEFSAALGGPDFQPGDAPRSYIAKVFDLWLAHGCRAFSRTTKAFSPFVAFEPLDFTRYVWPPGSDDPFIPKDTEADNAYLPTL